MGPLILLALGCGCSGPGTVPGDDDDDDVIAPPTGSTGETGTTGFEGLADRAGYIVQEGSFGFLEPSTCCAACGNCLWNNPSTPYGSYALPPGAGQTVDNPDPNAAGPTFYLRGDEAVVFLGTTPPSCRYFSWRSYLSERVIGPGDPIPPAIQPQCDGLVGVGDRALVIGSLGPSLNHLVVSGAIGDPFDQTFAVVTTADRATEDEVVSLLVESGFDASHVFFDRIPAGDPDLDLRLGWGPEQDSFQVAVRIAVYEDEDAGAAYEASPGRVLRLTPAQERPTTSLHPRQSLPAIGTGTDEDDRAAAVAALSDALLASYPGYTAIERTSTQWDYPSLDCIDDLYCSGEIRDRYYARVPDFLLLPGSFAVAFGVNHERTGKASYSNFAVDTVENLIGLDSVNSASMVGSVESWMPGHAQGDDLYAWVISRDCGEHPGRPCVQVGDTCPTGLPVTDPLLISFRAYLEPTTGAKPLGTELVPDRVLLFLPESG